MLVGITEKKFSMSKVKAPQIASLELRSNFEAEEEKEKGSKKRDEKGVWAGKHPIT